MSAFKSIVPIQQQQFNPVAGPVTGYITPVDMTGMEANPVIQLAKSLSDISPALRTLAGSYLKEDIAAAQQAGEAMDFTGVKLSASPEENEKQFRDFIQKNNAPLAANPYFLIAARSSYGRRMAQDYENEIRSQKDALTAPFNAVNYDQVAQASRQKFIEQMGNNFYSVNAFNEAANQSDSRLRRYYFEEQSKKAEEFHKDQVATEAGNLLSALKTPGADTAVLGQVSDLIHREVTMKGLDGKDFMRKTLYGILQDPNLSADDIDYLMADLHDVNLGKAAVSADGVLWGELQGMARTAKNRLSDNNALEVKRIQSESERLIVKDAGELGWAEMLRNYADMGAPEAAVPIAISQLKTKNPNVGAATWDRVQETLMDQALAAKKQKYEAETLSQEAVNRTSTNTLTEIENRLFEDSGYKATPEQLSVLTPKDRQAYYNKRASNDTYDYFKAQIIREPLMVTLYPVLGIDPSIPGSQAEVQQLNVEWLNFIEPQRTQIMEKALAIQNFEQRKDYIQQTVATAFESWKKSKIEVRTKQQEADQNPYLEPPKTVSGLVSATAGQPLTFTGQAEALDAGLKDIMSSGGPAVLAPRDYRSKLEAVNEQVGTARSNNMSALGFSAWRDQRGSLYRNQKELADFLKDPTTQFYTAKGGLGDLTSTQLNKVQVTYLYFKLRSAYGYTFADYQAKAKGEPDTNGIPFAETLDPFRTSMVSSDAELQKLRDAGVAEASKAFPGQIKTEQDFNKFLSYQRVLLDLQLIGAPADNKNKAAVPPRKDIGGESKLRDLGSMPYG